MYLKHAPQLSLWAQLYHRRLKGSWLSPLIAFVLSKRLLFFLNIRCYGSTTLKMAAFLSTLLMNGCTQKLWDLKKFVTNVNTSTLCTRCLPTEPAVMKSVNCEHPWWHRSFAGAQWVWENKQACREEPDLALMEGSAVDQAHGNEGIFAFPQLRERM